MREPSSNTKDARWHDACPHLEATASTSAQSVNERRRTAGGLSTVHAATRNGSGHEQ